MTAAVCSAVSSKAPCFFICALSSSAIEATASTSFSSMQITLLSKLAPLTMSRPAFAKSAVSSTTTGGLPGPAAITFLPLFIAARTTAGPPVTTSRFTSGCSNSACALSIVGSLTVHSTFGGPPARWMASFRKATVQALTLWPPGAR